MKKGEIAQGIVEKVLFPNKGIVRFAEGEACQVKNVLEGQQVSVRITKKRKGKYEGNLQEVIASSPKEIPSACPHFGACGGCSYQSLAYEEQLRIKENQVRELLEPVLSTQKKMPEFDPIHPSPLQFGYRNKMEFSFGDAMKDGPLELGMHKRGSFYDIVTVSDCQIVDEDYRKILTCVLDYARDKRLSFFHRLRHVGFLRHLLVRKASRTGEILIALVTTSQEEHDFQPMVDDLLKLNLSGSIAGILHIRNDSVADAIKDEGQVILYGKDYFYEELLGMRFRITPFSFFQTNSLGAEVLYQTAREYIGETTRDVEGNPDQVIFDLYSGTGTIAQMMSPVAKKVIGVEIVEEAVEAAKENAKLNGLHNCEFIAGDVLKIIGELSDKPDLIILDPPRDGIHPKALQKIIDFGVEHIVYISCKPTSLARDLELFIACGYEAEKVTTVDMFPGTVHVETVVLLTKQNI